MMKTIRYISLVVFAALLSVVAGCERRPIEDLNNSLLLKINIKTDIQNVPEGSLAQPELMRVIFYNPTTLTKITEDYLPAGGGPVNVPVGDYKLLVYNFDTESTLIKNDNYFYSIEAYTGPIKATTRNNLLKTIKKSQETRAESGEQSEKELEWAETMKALEESEIVYEPEHLFVSHSDETIYKTSGVQEIPVYPTSVVETYYISVQAKNVKYMASATALLTGQVKSNKIGFDKEEGKSEEDVTLYFTMKAKEAATPEESDMVYATFNTFGKLPNVESRLWLTILITNTDGTTEEWHKDITDEFDDNDDKRIEIVEPDIIDIPIPDNPTTGGGFTPTVEDWDEENHDINI